MTRFLFGILPGCISLAASFCLAGPAAQRKALPPGPPGNSPAAATPDRGDAKAKKLLDDARAQIKQQAWAEALTSLQNALDLRDDVLLPAPAPTADGKASAPNAGAWSQALEIFASLPAPAQEQYERQHGGNARAELVNGLLTGDAVRVGRVAQRFRPTRAGQIALELLRRGLREPPRREGDWRLFRRDPQRSARTAGDRPFLEPSWTLSALPRSVMPQRWVAEAQKSAPMDMLPAFFPVAISGRLVYRDYYGIKAVDLKTGELLWDSRAMNSLEGSAGDNAVVKRLRVSEWYNHYERSHYPVLFENSSVATLSADAGRVYYVDDLAVPPHPQWWSQSGWQPQQPHFGPDLFQPVMMNQLVAIDRETGKAVWELGGRRDASVLRGSYFLGPPLPLGGRLYVLTEKDGVLSLVCLVPPPEGYPPEVLWVQPLASVRDRLSFDADRRMKAVHLAYAQGTLVCPTNAGAVFGVDPLTHAIRWANFYHETPGGAVPPGKPVPNVGPGGRPLPAALATTPRPGAWKNSAPAVAGDKVLLAAPDSPNLLCLNGHDGRAVWQVPRGEDLYVGGVHGDTVLLVGLTHCRAVRLTDGKPLWRLEAGMPSGQGFLSGNEYFLPVRGGARDDPPGVAVLDLDRGRRVAFAPARGEARPGNLLFSDGLLISQTTSAVCAFPTLKARLKEVDDRMRNGGEDAARLVRRAELRLAGGSPAGAVDDLRVARSLQPPPAVAKRVRDDLYRALSQLLEQDFAAGEPYLDEYRDLCDVAAPETATAMERVEAAKERQRRQVLLHLLLARGRDRQGRAPEALRSYLDYVALAPPEPITPPGDASLHVAPEHWVAGQVTALYRRATPAGRQALDEEIRRRLESGRADVTALRRFVSLFGVELASAAEAPLDLAERLIRQEAGTEAELLLLRQQRQETEPARRARGLEALARLDTARGLVTDAAACYRRLARDYAATPVRAGQTGADVVRALAADRRFLPLLEEPVPARRPGPVRVTELPGEPAARQRFPLDLAGEFGPFLERCHPAVVRAGNGAFEFVLLDRDTGGEVWTEPLTGLARGGGLSGSLPPRLTAHVVGHVLVLPFGPVVYALDLAARRKLWERLLSDPAAPTPAGLVQRPDGRFYRPALPTTPEVGSLGPVTASYVCLRTRAGLEALDPLTGKVLWSRSDAPPHHPVFGDEAYLGVVETAADGRPTASRVLSAHSGTVVPAADFAALYANQVRVLGAGLLVAERTADRLTLRQRDVCRGEDLWQATFAAKALVLQSEDPRLVGVLEPDGSLSAFDLRTRAPLFQTKLDLPPAEPTDHGWLLADAAGYVVVLNRAGLVTSVPATNLFTPRTLAVNGRVYALDRDGRVRWQSKEPLAHQALLVEQFADLAALTFASLSPGPPGKGPRPQPTFTARLKVLAKDSGEVCFTKDVAGVPAQGLFHSLRVLRGGQTVELAGAALVLRQAVGDAPEDK
jgi:outer membrane protein assembly factor BamB